MEVIFTTLSVSSFELKTSKKAFFHPKKQWNIIINWKHEVWYIVELHPTILDQMKISTKWQVVYAEINITRVLENQEKKNLRIVSKYDTLKNQILTRDLNFVVQQENNFDKIIDAVKETSWVENVSIFDVYQWENLPEWKKSIALSITIKWDGKMKTEEINAIMDNTIENVAKVGGELRE